MNAVDNKSIAPQQYAQGQGTLGQADTELLKTIFSGALLKNGRAKAGHGYMGLTVNGEGKAVPVKFLTHVSERGWKTDSKIMKENLTGDSGAKALKSSDDLENELMRMAEKVGADKTVKDLIDGYRRHADSTQQRALLSRKIVFSAASAINKKLQENERLNVKTVAITEKPDDTTVATAANPMKTNKQLLYRDRDLLTRFVKTGGMTDEFVDEFVESYKNDQNVDRLISSLSTCVWGDRDELKTRICEAVRAFMIDENVKSKLREQPNNRQVRTELLKELEEKIKAKIEGIGRWSAMAMGSVESLCIRQYDMLESLLVKMSVFDEEADTMMKAFCKAQDGKKEVSDIRRMVKDLLSRSRKVATYDEFKAMLSKVLGETFEFEVTDLKNELEDKWQDDFARLVKDTLTRTLKRSARAEGTNKQLFAEYFMSELMTLCTQKENAVKK